MRNTTVLDASYIAGTKYLVSKVEGRKVYLAQFAEVSVLSWLTPRQGGKAEGHCSGETIHSWQKAARPQHHVRCGNPPPVHSILRTNVPTYLCTTYLHYQPLRQGALTPRQGTLDPSPALVNASITSLIQPQPKSPAYEGP